MARPKKIKPEEEAKVYTNPCDQFFMESAALIGSKFGAEVVSSAVDEDKNLKFLEVPDLVSQWSLGRKGYALGRILYVMGFEGASKTSFSLWVANLAYRAGGFAAMVETEQASSAEHMSYYLDSPEKFRVYHPETIEDAMSITVSILNSYAKIDPEGLIPKVLILDSIAGSTDERTTEDEDTILKSKVGGTAKLIKDATNLIKIKLKQTNTLWVVLNQARDHIDTSGGLMRIPEIDKIVSTGGRAIPFAATYWAILKKQAAIKEAGDKVGFKVKMTYKKNKLRVPGNETYYHVKYSDTLDFVEETMAYLSMTPTYGIIKTKKGYYCEEIGISEEEAISAEKMYELIHSPEHKPMFQEMLGIITTDTVLTYNPPQNNNDTGTNKPRENTEETLPVPSTNSEGTQEDS
jgi:RecA/RadA recombinase